MNMNSNGSDLSAPKGHESLEPGRPFRPPGDDRLKTSTPDDQGDSHAEDCPPPPPSSRVGEIKPAVPSGDHAQEGTPLPQQDNRASDLPGCERMAEGSQPHQNGTIDQVCAGPENPAVTVEAATRPAHCEHPGCKKTPRYGAQDEPPRFCQAHKRAGQYTVRNGELFIATRDGRAFREDSGTKATGAAAVAGPKHAVQSLAAPTAATAPPEEVNTLSSSPVPSEKKLCEEPGCDIESTYGTAGSGKPRFCIRHKKKSHVNLSNIPCLFPGCDIRPRYGLSMGKPVCCVTHKKQGMVHLLKEAQILEMEAHARYRKRRKSHLHVSEKNDQQETKDDSSKAVAPAEKPVKGPKEGGGTKGIGGGKGKGPARGKGYSPTQAKGLKATGKASQLLVSLPSTSSTSASSSPRPAPAQGKQISPKTEALPPSGLAPSDEMRLFQEARESARAAAEASGSGRRARAPSRKCLEASGKMVAESVQWMTKEKREQEARLKMEMKEQRKAAAAAGLKFGHYFEAVALSTPVRARDGADVEGMAGGGALTGGEGTTSSMPGQKLTPAKVGRADGEPNAVGEAQQSLNGDVDTAAEASNVATTDDKGETEPSPAATEEKVVPKRKRKQAVSAPGSTARQGLTVVDGGGKRKSTRNKTGGTPVKAVVCGSESCSETATHGVNGTVRYCKEHRIFGMYKIVGGY